MDKLCVLGIGISSRIGHSITEIESQLFSNKTENDLLKINQDIVLDVPQRVKRRMNRYSQIVHYVSDAALDDKTFSWQCSNQDIGTIFSTGYGPMVSSLVFSDSIVDNRADLSSPIVFANTTLNSCLGHLCINRKLKGVSSMLMGSNNLWLSQQLLSNHKAKYIVTGAIDEKCPELFEDFSSILSMEADVSEGAVAFLVGINEKNNYGKVSIMKNYSLPEYPLFSLLSKSEVIEEMVMYFKEIEQENIDVIFSSANGSYFDEFEEEALKTIFPNTVIFEKSKSIFGETLDASFNLNIVLALLTLKNNSLPFNNMNVTSKIKKILVTGFTMSGNYMTSIVEN